MLIASCSGGASPEPTGQVESALAGAAPDTTSSWVVGVANEHFQTICTGTLVAPNLVLTTRHCLDWPPNATLDCSSSSFAPAVPDDEMVVTTCADIRQLGSSRDCRWHRSAKLFRPSNPEFCGNDIALVLLRESVSSTEAVPARPELGELASVVPLDTAFTMIGFGAIDSNRGQWGIRRRLDGMKLSCVEGTTECRPFVFGGAVAPGEFVSASTGVCDGDSGGPATIQGSNGGRLFGVASRGGSLSGDCVSSIFTRLDTWRDFIMAAGRDAATAGHYTPPDWAAPTTGPTSVVTPITCPNGTTCGPLLVKGSGCSTSHTPVTGGLAGTWLAALAGVLLALRRARTSRRDV